MLAQQFADRKRGHADGVDRQKEEGGVIVEQLAAISDEVWQAFFKTPDFSFGAAPELGWIEDDTVVSLASPHLAGCEFCRIVNDPADWLVCQTGKDGIGLGGIDRLFGGVDMCDCRARARKRKAPDTGIAEQVERGRVRPS